eukprot:TRINITY_DN36699_c0_g1_i1.p2 TRINITY_DN36699_c0_g1~~TRINITY_DN36699_c0_g1_i1.p2  ORF type:complete len:261 (+),score=89.07 TRINITY_DN36699_c0_g1_i1:197-979(+)
MATMLGKLGGAAASSQGQAGGKRRQERQGTVVGTSELQQQIDEVRAGLLDVGILAAVTARETQTIKGAIFSVVTYSAAEMEPMAETLVNTLKIYAEKAKALSLEQKQEAAAMSPHLFLWYDLIDTSKKMLEKLQPKHRDLLEPILKHIKELEDTAEYRAKKKLGLDILMDKDEAHKEAKYVALREAIAEQVLVARHSRCWAHGQYKLETVTRDKTTAKEAEKAVHTMMIGIGKGRFRIGAAPKTNLERKVQAFIDKNREQ